MNARPESEGGFEAEPDAAAELARIEREVDRILPPDSPDRATLAFYAFVERRRLDTLEMFQLAYDADPVSGRDLFAFHDRLNDDPALRDRIGYLRVRLEQPEESVTEPVQESELAGEPTPEVEPAAPSEPAIEQPDVPVDPDRLIDLACAEFGVEREVLLATHSQRAMIPRRATAYLLSELGMKQRDIGQSLGGRRSGTTSHLIASFRRDRGNPEVERSLERILAQYQGDEVPPPIEPSDPEPVDEPPKEAEPETQVDADRLIDIACNEFGVERDVLLAARSRQAVIPRRATAHLLKQLGMKNREIGQSLGDRKPGTTGMLIYSFRGNRGNPEVERSLERILAQYQGDEVPPPIEPSEPEPKVDADRLIDIACNEFGVERETLLIAGKRRASIPRKATAQLLLDLGMNLDEVGGLFGRSRSTMWQLLYRFDISEHPEAKLHSERMLARYLGDEVPEEPAEHVEGPPEPEAQVDAHRLIELACAEFGVDRELLLAAKRKQAGLQRKATMHLLAELGMERPALGILFGGRSDNTTKQALYEFRRFGLPEHPEIQTQMDRILAQYHGEEVPELESVETEAALTEEEASEESEEVPDISEETHDPAEEKRFFARARDQEPEALEQLNRQRDSLVERVVGELGQEVEEEARRIASGGFEVAARNFIPNEHEGFPEWAERVIRKRLEVLEAPAQSDISPKAFVGEVYRIRERLSQSALMGGAEAGRSKAQDAAREARDFLSDRLGRSKKFPPLFQQELRNRFPIEVERMAKVPFAVRQRQKLGEFPGVDLPFLHELAESDRDKVLSLVLERIVREVHADLSS